MKRKTVFLRAAKIIDAENEPENELGLGACEAIWLATTGSLFCFQDYKRTKDGADVRAFVEMFKPHRTPLAYWLERADQTKEETRQRRVIALLLAHAMRQTGDI